MTVIDYAEKIGVYKYLSNSQIDVLNEWQKAKDRGEEMLITCCARGARTLLITITERYLGYMEGFADGRADAIDEFKKNVLIEFCEACNQVSCDGGTEGSIQECSTIRTLRYVVNRVAEELKEKKE